MRKETEIKLENREITIDPMVDKDKRAKKEFDILKSLFEEISTVAQLDSYLINQYCLAVSELEDMLALFIKIRKSLRTIKKTQDLTEEDLETFLQLDVEIRQKRAEIIKMGDRLYLNPVARIKAVPPKNSEGEDTDPMTLLLARGRG